jgi:hypothetical protein
LWVGSRVKPVSKIGFELIEADWFELGFQTQRNPNPTDLIPTIFFIIIIIHTIIIVIIIIFLLHVYLFYELRLLYVNVCGLLGLIFGSK